MRFRFQVLVIWALISMAFWGYLYFTSPLPATFMYPAIWLLGVGLPFYYFRKKWTSRMLEWSAPPALKFFILAYGMVLLEEIIAAYVNHLSEGFSFGLFLARILQFWSFNFLAFTGLIVAWYILYRRYDYSFHSAFSLIGLYGLFAEKTYILLFSNPLAFFFWVPLIFLSYGLILSPALGAMPLNNRRPLARPIQVLAGIGLPLILATLMMPLIQWVKENHPELFPPAGWIGG